MQFIITIITAIFSFALAAVAQMATLPQCVQTCLHNAAPQCSGLTCYCSALNSTSLLSAASCYYTLCDSTTPEPLDILLADVGPLCFQNGVPVRQDQVNAALAIESTSTFSTYLDLTDGSASTPTPVSADLFLATGVVPTTMATTAVGGSGETSGQQASSSVLFASNTKLPFGVVAPSATATSSAGAGRSNGEVGHMRLLAGVAMGLAGLLLWVTG